MHLTAPFCHGPGKVPIYPTYTSPRLAVELKLFTGQGRASPARQVMRTTLYRRETHALHGYR